MSDIKKGYTFTDKSTDWASNKDTAIRLNKMMDEAKVNLVAGTNVTITPTINGPLIDVAGSGSGDVVGPASATDNALARFDGTTGKLIQNSVVTVDDTTGNMAGVGTLTVGGALTYGGVTLTNNVTGTGKMVLDNNPILVTPNLGTPSTLVGTNITGTASDLTAGTVTTNANLTGDVTSVGNATSIASNVIVDADINSSAAIADTKLATIATALKVSNSATTATSANTASAIVARDASGNFSAGTITASLSGNATNVTGIVAVANGGSGTSSPSLVAGTNVTISGSWPNQTINSTAGGGGGGTVTSVSVVTANGVSGSVANPTTTPAITLTLGDISAATSKPSGGTARSFTSRNGDVFNVRDYGALGDGSTDDSTAFQSAVDAAVASLTGGCVYIPAGRYVLNSRIVKTGIALPKSLSIVGDGQGVSVLSAYSASGVFQIGFAAKTEGSQNSLLMADFSVAVETTSATAATGFDLSWGASASNTFQSLEIRGITFNPQSAYFGTSYYKRFIKLTNVWNAKIHDCLVRGPNTIPSGLDSCVGIELATNSGSESNPVHITDCDFYGVTIGVYITGNLESTIMDQCMFLGDYGVYCIPATAQEHLSISNCHASNKFYSVYAEQMFRVYVHDCVFFGDNGGSGYIGIYLTTSTPFAKIHDNYIRGNAGSNGIVTTSASQIVHSNTFIGTATGYWMQSGTNNSIAYGNISFTSDAGVLGGTSVLNSGTGNQVFNNY